MPLTKPELMEQISVAFANLPFPKDFYGIHCAEAADDYRDPTEEERRLDRRLHWQNVTIEQLKRCPSALSFLRPDGYRFYLPAFMTLSLRYEEDQTYNGYAFMDSAEYSVLPTKQEDLLDYQEERHATFDAVQIQAIIAYLKYFQSRQEWTINDYTGAIAYWEAKLPKSLN